MFSINENKFKVTLIVSLILNISYSQNFNIPFRAKNQWGYANAKGEIIIKPIYDSVSYDSYNFRWEIFKNGKTGIINEKGDEIFSPIYDSIYKRPVYSSYNEFEIYKNGLMGYADMYGELILPIAYKNISKADDESFNKLELKFFVEQNNTNYSQLIDETETLLLDSISNFKNIYRGNYIIHTKKAGIFNIIEKKWKIKPEFDSIERFYYENLEPKEEYSNYNYYGIKNQKIVLFDAIFQSKETNVEHVKDLFLAPKDDDDSVVIYDSVQDISKLEIIDVTYSNSDDLQQFNGKYQYPTHLKIIITKEKNKFSINTNEPSTKATKKHAFDAIKMFKNTNAKDEYDHRYALVKTKNKWQIFNLSTNDFVSKTTFESFEFHPKFQNILLLKNKSKVGIFKFDSDYKKDNFFFMEPKFEKFVTLKYVKSNSEKFKNFDIYIFESNQKLCPIGENLIPFYFD